MDKNNPVVENLFEISWEVCNYVSGIHTVISSKVLEIGKRIQGTYLLIGPDTWRDSGDSQDFSEDKRLFRPWREKMQQEGFRIRIGHWNIPGSPATILIDFTTFMNQKDKIFSHFWEKFRLDSISGQWDYIEPALFGYAAGKTIERFAGYYLAPTGRTIAHFHEWSTGTGLLYLHEHARQIATVFTTHSTVIGKALAGNKMPLYSRMKHYDADAKSNDFNVVSKQSLEELSAAHADVFTTVSKVTARECKQFLKREVDLVTPNGLEERLVTKDQDYESGRREARQILLRVARALTGKRNGAEPFILGTAGRYEPRVKGYDILLDALAGIGKDKDQEREIIAFFFVPAGHYGPREELTGIISGKDENGLQDRFGTHKVRNPESDYFYRRVRELHFENHPSHPVKMIFVPAFLNGRDGIFNKGYYDLLPGFDLTVFPSYYEPWGYTPLESLAFGVPTLTSSFAGFGNWIKDHAGETGLSIGIIEREDNGREKSVSQIRHFIEQINMLDPGEYEAVRQKARELSGMAMWKELIRYYIEAYGLAMEKLGSRTDLYFTEDREDTEEIPVSGELPVWKQFVVLKELPPRLAPLEEIAKNLWWSWNYDAIELFSAIDPRLWKACEENPVVFIENIPLNRYKELAGNKTFMEKLDKVGQRFRGYLRDKKDKEKPQVAYFSMEFGLHDSLKIYSGGLGMLAGDYLKEASDCNLDIVAVGLLYRYGYFNQVVSAGGEQIESYESQDFSKSPVFPLRDESGKWKTIGIVLPGRELKARIWKVNVGRIELLLLDTDFEENIDQDRSITHHLYGGNEENRFKQEFLLGVGGIRALDLLGYEPDLFHCNEGHAAFLGLERLRKCIRENRMTFYEAREIIRASSLFTTHTPVPAGHDSFDEGMLRMYMAHYPERLKISWKEFMGLGRLNPDDPNERFSMSHLAINLSQEINGVSRIHGNVTQKMFNAMWKGYNPDELHIGYVTNGVHFPTWIGKSLMELLYKYLGRDFMQRQSDPGMWKKILEIPDEELWANKIEQKTRLIKIIKERMREAAIKRMENPRYLVEVQEKLDPEILTVGFARRFATYKRAHLLFRDVDRLVRIVNHSERPVQFIFAGKAHPKDKGGKELIKRIVEISKQPGFVGRIIFLQNYDISLARELVRGVDVWLNTPARPLEASGTSGEKVVMNGGLHFSVLDGWWAEGYARDAGWAISEEKVYQNQEYQDELDAETIYSIFENEIVPLYYERDEKGIPPEWARFIKNSLTGIAPRFTLNRMLLEYKEKYYRKLYDRFLLMKENNYRMARRLTHWKKRIHQSWHNIEVESFEHPDISKKPVILGKKYESHVVLNLNGLPPSDVGVEIVIRESGPDGEEESTYTQEFEMAECKNNKAHYQLLVEPVKAGIFRYGIRIFPKHEDLPHRQDFAFVKWV